MRSANAPTISAGVMQAKVIWKTTKTISGMKTPCEKVATMVVGVDARPGTALREAADEGVEPPPSVKARL